MTDVPPDAAEREALATEEFVRRINSVAESSSPWLTVTTALVLLNIAAFVAMAAYTGDWFGEGSLLPYVRFGANNGAATTNGEWWRLVTSLFIHYGILHLTLNMWALYQGGQFVERLLGRWLFALTYFGAGLTGGLASIWWHGDRTWSAGASGAIFGIFGALFGYMVRQKQTIPAHIFKRLQRSSITFAGYNILFALMNPKIDNSAHIGGALGGIVLGWVVALPLDPEIRRRKTRVRLLAGTLVLSLIVIVGGALLPRFDYNPTEQLVLDQINEPFVDRDESVQNRQQQILGDLAGGRATPEETATALESEVVPFYRNWLQHLAPTKFDIHRRTAVERAAYWNLLQLRVESSEELAKNLRAHDIESMARFEKRQQEIGRQIAELNRLRSR